MLFPGTNSNQHVLRLTFVGITQSKAVGFGCIASYDKLSYKSENDTTQVYETKDDITYLVKKLNTGICLHILLWWQDLQRRLQKSKLYERLSYQNPMLPDLCGVLFPGNKTSAWGGPHSLVAHSGSAQASSIQAAIEALMK